jgi:hypothetical protein
MKMADIRDKARRMSVEPSGIKQDVIRRIQSAEGNQPCFGTRTECDQGQCCWRKDCLPRNALRVP